MKILLTKLSDIKRHFTCTRVDSGSESLELEARSFLIHDLTHFALESTAKLSRFYSTLAAATPYGALAGETAQPVTGEARATETVVGPLSGALRGDIDAPAFTARLAGYFTDLGPTRLRG